MRYLTILVVATLAMGTLATPASAQASKKKGQTIFGDDRKSTMKAMKNISKALGVKCLYCHVKEGGKVVYTKETPEKEIARQMKWVFVDSLAVADTTVQISFSHDGKTTNVQALYKASGEDAGIHLMAQADKEPKKEGMVGLPSEGETLSCKTCHGGKVHIFAKKTTEDK